MGPHLKQKQISDYSINKAITQIDPDEYFNTLKYLAENKLVKGKSDWDRKAKLKRYLASKGYENDLINEVIL